MGDHPPQIVRNTEIFRKLCAQREILPLAVGGLSEEPRYPFFLRWLEEGKHGSMEFLKNYPRIRENPQNLDRIMRSVWVLGFSYGEKQSPRRQKSHHAPRQPLIAQYARFKDYHKVLRQRGGELMEAYLQSWTSRGGGGGGRQSRKDREKEESYLVAVDSAPVMEKSLAERLGAGFIGKNTLLIRPGVGSFLFLFEIFSTFEAEHWIADGRSDNLESSSGELASLGVTGGSISTGGTQVKKSDSPQILASQESLHNTQQQQQLRRNWSCGSCRRCQVHCPSGALNRDYVLDATKCLAYYTIEHRGLIPVSYWSYLREYYFGCDICQLVCPHNRYARKSQVLIERVPPDLDLYDVATMSQCDYENWFGGTPMTRAKISGLRRNALIALVVMEDPRLSLLGEIIQAPCYTDELVRATWYQRHHYDEFRSGVLR